MNPPAQFSHVRLWLYLGANCLPAVLQWLTLNYDTSPRGLEMLTCSLLITFCVTTRAYLDGKTTDKVVSETLTTVPKETPTPPGPTVTTSNAPLPPVTVPLSVKSTPQVTEK